MYSIHSSVLLYNKRGVIHILNQPKKLSPMSQTLLMSNKLHKYDIGLMSCPPKIVEIITKKQKYPAKYYKL